MHDKPPGYLTIVFTEDGPPNPLLQILIEAAEVGGYTVSKGNDNSVVLERGYHN
jgi:hypothetical protein